MKKALLLLPFPEGARRIYTTTKPQAPKPEALKPYNLNPQQRALKPELLGASPRCAGAEYWFDAESGELRALKP